MMKAAWPAATACCPAGQRLRIVRRQLAANMLLHLIRMTAACGKSARTGFNETTVKIAPTTPEQQKHRP
jgi:hypothetical protein